MAENEKEEIKKEEPKFTKVEQNPKKENVREKDVKSEKSKPSKSNSVKEKAKKEKPVKEKGKKRKIFARFLAVVIILALVIGIILVALPSPARALEEMFRDLKAGKMQDVTKYVDYNELINIPALGSANDEQSGENASQDDAVLFEELQWNIKKIEKSSDEAKIEVEITNRNYKTVIQNFTKKIVQKVLSNENPSDEEAKQYLMEELKNKDSGTLTSTQTITVTKQDGKWKVMVDDNLKKALFPGLEDAVNSYDQD